MTLTDFHCPSTDLSGWQNLNAEGMGVTTDLPGCSVRLSFRGGKPGAIRGKVHGITPGGELTVAVQSDFSVFGSGLFIGLRESATGHLTGIRHTFSPTAGWIGGGGVAWYVNADGAELKPAAAATYPATQLAYFHLGPNAAGAGRVLSYSASGKPGSWSDLATIPDVLADGVVVAGIDGAAQSSFAIQSLEVR